MWAIPVGQAVTAMIYGCFSSTSAAETSVEDSSSLFSASNCACAKFKIPVTAAVSWAPFKAAMKSSFISNLESSASTCKCVSAEPPSAAIIKNNSAGWPSKDSKSKPPCFLANTTEVLVTASFFA